MAPIEYKGHIVYNKNMIDNDPLENNYKYGDDGYKVTVMSGDSIYSIARKKGILMADLVSINNIKPPYTIYEGDILSIPAVKYHKVIKGDSLNSIARDYGTSIGKLMFLNKLDSYKIVIGQILVVNSSGDYDDGSISESEIPPLKPNKEEIAFETENNFSWPCLGEVISTFGSKGNGLYNDGINIGCQKESVVVASEKGNIVYAGDKLKGYGNLVILKHSNGFISSYAHLNEIAVQSDELVEKGEVIGYVGDSGNVKQPQLFFSIRKDRKAIDPEIYIEGDMQ